MMNELQQYLSMMIEAGVTKVIISNPAQKSAQYKKIVVEQKGSGYQIARYTEKQAFHENVDADQIKEKLSQIVEGAYRQVNGMSSSQEHMILLSKKGKCTYKVNQRANDQIRSAAPVSTDHNRKKNYILNEGMVIPPLVDMGVFTQDGKVVNSMYDKYKQINRFIEILDDEIAKSELKKLNIIDFGCGKSYLTFVIYYYLTEVRGMEVQMIGLDLKADVIRKCNAAAEKYGYQNLRFEMGDINGYTAPFDVDMVVTLHACDTATDFALYNAIQWNARMIFSVPCCQHELNAQNNPRNLGLLSRYGIIKERFSALATDAIRANLLEYCGYKTQLLEFIDLDHTPKNILIRAVKKPVNLKIVREKALGEVLALMKEFSFYPMLFKLLGLENTLEEEQYRQY